MTPEKITRAAVLGVAGGAIFMIVFGALWSVFTLFGLSGMEKIIFGVALVLVTAALSVTCVLIMRGARHLPNDLAPEAVVEGKTRSRNMIILILVQVVTIVAVDASLGIRHLSTVIPPATSLIVGLYFFPIAILFKFPFYFLAGSLVSLLAIAALVAPFYGIIQVGPYPWAEVVYFGSTELFWLSGVYVLFVARRMLSRGIPTR